LAVASVSTVKIGKKIVAGRRANLLTKAHAVLLFSSRRGSLFWRRGRLQSTGFDLTPRLLRWI
jgi:hypothetical protein